MWMMIWPLAMVIFSSILYSVASKGVPANGSPFVTIIITYITAGLISFILYMLLDSDRAFWRESLKVALPGIVLGLSMVGLEIGYIFMYRAGWKISIASLLANILLAVALLAIGFIFYRERLNTQQIIGFILCVAGSVMLLNSQN